MESALSHFSASPWLIIPILAIVFVAAIVQVELGMGFGLTAAPLLALIDPVLVPASALFLGLATASWGAWKERDAICWREVRTGMIGRLAGVVVATLILTNLADKTSFTLVFGLMIGLAVLLSIAGWKLAFTRGSLAGMAMLSGVMGTITSVGGPPLAIVYQHRPAKEARPTLAAFFAIGCAISLCGLYLTSWAGLADFGLALVMTPAMLAGLAVAHRLRGRFDARYRPALLAISGLAALILIARGLA
ncbi:MAG: sulfite exporter TauE/SafE family protein [Hoeflea sp.]|uniref:sulfite exporter TauE/SafE family protein n=1 Tax=Hoeflea sp. TaxID=1940281 RepID=UPI003EF97548